MLMMIILTKTIMMRMARISIKTVTVMLMMTTTLKMMIRV